MDYPIKKCLACGNDFKPATANARYCSDECRKVIAKQRSKEQAARRKLDQRTTDIQPPIETPSLPPAETPNLDTTPPTETTVPLNPGNEPEDKGESKKPFRKFFYE